MFRCKDIAHHASDYLDQQLTWRQRLAFKLHLFICRNCRQYVHQIGQTVAGIRLMAVKQQNTLTTDQKKMAENLQKIRRKN
ncbi:hypothetical protein Q7C_125 [Methylophaga frappieri]|uniref:Putative zinc-finger domain-containing protein n=1 Tax=Methylophaga frappieri (strain ATCC BAA-2434 / DSM 25690 / JAM7) TaxID=754477 RepID=I1YEG3_METFJ|nr:zf-HC2 domain-containing protein [Methylophaga frappieri]AFJ01306.1 hypothetical protein Q7C_125 [Methylophaga frappieri]